MSAKRANYFTMIGVPYLSVSLVSPYSKVLPSVAPSHTSYLIILRKFRQLLHLGCARAPNVYGSVEPYRQNILLAPIDKIKVKIILQLWSIEHLKWHLANLPCLLTLIR